MRSRRLDPTALYAAVMTVACLMVSTCPGQVRAGADVAADSEAKCVASQDAGTASAPIEPQLQTMDLTGR